MPTTSKPQSDFVPSLHLFADEKKENPEFCDIEYIKDFHKPFESPVKSSSLKVNELQALSASIQNLRSEAKTKFILFNAPQNNAHCLDLLLETAWELTKRNLGRIVIVDGDFRSNALNKKYRLKNTAGVADYVLGKLVAVDQIIKKTNIENVYLIQSGELPKEKISLLMSEKFTELTDRLKMDFDYILFNSPPYLGSIDSFLLSKVLRPVFVQVALNGTSTTLLSGIKSEIDVLELPMVTISNGK